MAEDPDTIVISRPAPAGDRIAFGVCGAGAIGAAIYLLDSLWQPDRFGPAYMQEQIWRFESFLWVGVALVGISLLVIALRGGTLTVTIDRKMRQLREVARTGPFKGLDRSFSFDELGAPDLYEDTTRGFIVEVGVKDRVAIQIGNYATRAEAERVLETVIAALDVAAPPMAPTDPAALNSLKASLGPGALSMREPSSF